MDIESDDFSFASVLRCGECGWSGPARQAIMEPFRELATLDCPECDRRILRLTYSQTKETSATAPPVVEPTDESPSPIRATGRSRWQRGGLHISVDLNPEGDFVISGQDLSGRIWAEYEYEMTVGRPAVREVIAALGGREGDDVVELFAEYAAEIIEEGEMSWLDRHSIPYEFWSREEPH